MKNFNQHLFRYIIKIVISSFAIYISTLLLSGVHISEPQYLNALILAVVLSLLNSFVKPIFIILTIPLTVFTLGIFLLFINTFMIMIASKLFSQFVVDSFWSALWFSIIVSLISTILQGIGNTKQKKYTNENQN